jgi:hypothetical protein
MRQLCGTTANNSAEGTRMSDERKESGPQAGTAADEWMTLGQAARALRRHRQTVQKLGNAGALVVDVRAGLTFVTRASVDAYRAAVAAAEDERAAVTV